MSAPLGRLLPKLPFAAPRAIALLASANFAVINSRGCIAAIDDGGRLFGACPEDGTLTKIFESDTEFTTPPKGSPAIIGGQLVVPVGNGSVLFFDALTGKREGEVVLLTLDKVATGDIVVPELPGDINAMVTWAGKVIAFYIWADGTIPAQYPEWTFPAPGGISGMVIGKAAGLQPVVYASCRDGVLYALNLADGSVKWQSNLFGRPLYEDPAVSRDGHFVFINVDGQGTYKLNAANGQLEWHLPSDDVTGGASIVIGQSGQLFVGNRVGQFFAFDHDTGAQLWEYDTGEDINAQAIVDAAGYVFFADASGTIHCLDSTDGTVEWKLDLGVPVSGGLVIDSDHALYVATEDGQILRVTGSQPPGIIPTSQPQSRAMWSQRGGNPHHSGQSKYNGPPATDGSQMVPAWTFLAEQRILEGAVATDTGLLIFPDDGGKIYAVAMLTGLKVWERDVGDGYVFGELGISPGASRVYYGASDGFVWALLAKDGTAVWSVEIKSAVQGSVTVTNTDNVFVSSTDGYVYGFNGATGAQFAKLSTGSGESLFPPVFLQDGKTLVVGSTDGFIRSYDPLVGNLRWRYQTHGPVLEVPCVHPVTGFIYVGAAAEIVAMQDDGDREWTIPAVEEMGASPGCGNKHNLLYIGGNDGAMHAFDEKTGTERWQYQTGAGIVSNPVMDRDGNVLYVTSLDGTLYALDATTGTMIWKKYVADRLQGDPVILADGSIAVTSADGMSLTRLVYSPAKPPPTPTPAAAPADAAGIVVGLLFAGIVLYAGGGYGYGYVRNGKMRHPHAGFWAGVGGRIGGCCSGSMRPSSVPKGYNSSIAATSSSSLGAGATAGSSSAGMPPPPGSGGGYGAL